MNELVATSLIFLALASAAIGTLLLYPRLRPETRQADTGEVIRQVGNLFALMTSLVLGLTINSAHNNFEQLNQNVHSAASQIVALDLSLKEYGPETDGMRAQLRNYVRQTLDETWRGGRTGVNARSSERLIGEFGAQVRRLHPSTPEQREIRAGLEQKIENIVQLRWMVIEQAYEIVPGSPFLLMLIAWLIVIFASLGYRAPRNELVIATFIIAALLIAGTLFLIMDMNRPFSGPVRISPTPIERALAEMQAQS